MAADRRRIVHVIRAKPPGEIGGADAHVVDLAVAQRLRGDDVAVVCLGPTRLGDALRSNGVPVAQTDSMSMVSWVRLLRAVLRSDRTDVVHSHGYRADLVAMLVHRFVRRSKQPTWAVTAHGFIRTSYGLRVLTRLDEFALGRADVVIAVSSSEATRLAQLTRRQVHLVPNGVRPATVLSRVAAKTELGCDPQRRLVGFVGRLTPEKRPDLFLDMAEIVACSHPDIEFVVIGSGPMSGDLQRRAAAGEARVVLTGLMPNAGTLMAAIDVLVCPSDSEGTPRVVIEAMLAGIAVVASDVGGVPDLIHHGHTGILVRPDSPVDVATAVSGLLHSEAHADSIGKCARAFATERFTAERMAAAVTATYPERSNRTRHGLHGRNDRPARAAADVMAATETPSR
jgi:L-malate glycosyltransferase